jgi:ribosome-binding ATPase YchF (GTP1/OBG family)
MKEAISQKHKMNELEEKHDQLNKQNIELRASLEETIKKQKSAEQKLKEINKPPLKKLKVEEFRNIGLFCYFFSSLRLFSCITCVFYFLRID